MGLRASNKTRFQPHHARECPTVQAVVVVVAVDVDAPAARNDDDNNNTNNYRLLRGKWQTNSALEEGFEVALLHTLHRKLARCAQVGLRWERCCTQLVDKCWATRRVMTNCLVGAWP